MAKKKGPVLSVGRGEKLPVKQGAGLTAKGRAKYNAARAEPEGSTAQGAPQESSAPVCQVCPAHER
jgi:hypothetical protein